ncbi:BZ3500_MvSof-1268-A1-R1_Chr4-3g07294 [Microbotryum saponariae]|uniref:BZ3500_MvSof-1268-A1-R1_Chr4-3g07294 protein n=1 Tax=Microbotryum saponariae TaxID=289078 RepID=A0A2X0NMJ0_9BASI|nr:BZ3500_MvSof-1268-A1-R1_Chr4-3g07294 [Microbotryum saponariae]SDA06957.1 BZ3501_MvSof-1269-A2-R1_Chr4-2g07003 [Microbotryum saponariae]
MRLSRLTIPFFCRVNTTAIFSGVNPRAFSLESIKRRCTSHCCASWLQLGAAAIKARIASSTTHHAGSRIHIFRIANCIKARIDSLNCSGSGCWGWKRTPDRTTAWIPSNRAKSMPRSSRGSVEPVGAELARIWARIVDALGKGNREINSVKATANPCREASLVEPSPATRRLIAYGVSTSSASASALSPRLACAGLVEVEARGESSGVETVEDVAAWIRASDESSETEASMRVGRSCDDSRGNSGTIDSPPGRTMVPIIVLVAIGKSKLSV